MVVEMNMGVGLALGIAIGSAVASGAVFAQTDSELSSNDPRQQRLEQVAGLQAQGGPTPMGLIEPLRTLALLYEENGDHALAIAALEDARHVTRVHEGLTSANEALLLREQIRNEKALELHARVWEHEQDMVTIARQNHDDIRMVPVFRDLAEDRADALEEYRGGGFPPEIELGCYYIPGPRRYDDSRGEGRTPTPPNPAAQDQSCYSGERRTVINAIHSESLMYYADAIEVIVKSGDYANPELRDLEKAAYRLSTFPRWFPVWASEGNTVDFGRLPPNPDCSSLPFDELLASEILGGCLEPVVHSNGIVIANVGGWASLVRLIAYEIRAGAPAAVRARAFADLADWHLLVTTPERRRFSGTSGAAFNLYEGAYRLLQQGADASAITEIYSPELPVTVPTFQPNPFAPAETGEPRRFIDVEFAVTRYGRAERIEILETSMNATRAEKRDLINLIETTTFRPRFVDGKLADAAPVFVRYVLRP